MAGGDGVAGRGGWRTGGLEGGQAFMLEVVLKLELS